jgi:hypothetical protein
MKTYSGELKDGMPVCNVDGKIIPYGEHKDFDIDMVFWDNEWQRYKPQPKKVWGNPEVGKEYYTIEYDSVAHCHYAKHNSILFPAHKNVYIALHHAEQYAKALNYINEFRALSDVPVDGVEQWFINSIGEVSHSQADYYKLKNGICGYVANSREKAERDLAAFPKIALAHKIVTWGYHGIVEEVL